MRLAAFRKIAAPTPWVVATSLLALCVGSSCRAEVEYAIGADISFLAQAEEKGVVFKDDGEVRPGLRILKDHGYNWARLRLFHTPDRLPNNLAYTIAQARAAKKLEFKFLLDLHYSDTWADPQKQFIPRAWKELSQDQLVDAVESYTRDVVAALIAADAAPDMVQIGNEVIAGMLWPNGQLTQNWPQFAELLKAGIRGAKTGAGDRPLQIMIHIDRGGDKQATKHFFDKCKELGVEYDVIGQSFYPWWHGSLDDLRDNMEFMATNYNKDIYLVEVAYNWRRAEYKDGNGPFPESPQGQKEFLMQVNQIVRGTPGDRGRGIFWWEPAVQPGPLASRGMFDQGGHALPVLEAFDEPRPQYNSASGSQ